MQNPYLKNLKKIEFVVTYACTGRCKHCSEGDHTVCGESIAADVAAEAVRKISAEYPVGTVMAFGGEPLLYPDTVCEIMEAARERNVPQRQIITNGYFSRKPERICEVATRLAKAGVNDVLLSVDAFHQESIPLEIVKAFALAIRGCGIPLRLQPAWLVSPGDDNPYNRETRRILDSFREIGISENDGNVIFPEGNAKKYLADYFSDTAPENPYAEDPNNVKCVSFSPNGDVLDGNVYRSEIMEIINGYVPKKTDCGTQL